MTAMSLPNSARLLLTSYVLSATPALAELRPLADADLAGVVGQAYLQVDQYYNPSESSVHYVRTTLGANIETQLNADVLELGRYRRWDEKRNDWEPQPADIHIQNYAMGHLFDKAYYARNPMIPEPRKPDGSAYQDGEIVPFRIVDPYLEIAMEEVDGVSQLVGVRLGFSQAEGSLSGDILSLTGNVDVLVRTNAAFLANQAGACDLMPELCDAVTDPVLGQVEIVNPARLVYPESTEPPELVGEIDEARATTIGIPNGESLDASAGDVAVGVPAQHCMAAALDVCFPLSQYRSLWVGARDEYGNLAGAAPGMFLSFQTRALSWLRNRPNENQAENYMTTVSGAFLNLPTGSVEIDTLGAMMGTERLRTEYIDRGRGLF